MFPTALSLSLREFECTVHMIRVFRREREELIREVRNQVEESVSAQWIDVASRELYQQKMRDIADALYKNMYKTRRSYEMLHNYTRLIRIERAKVQDE